VHATAHLETLVAIKQMNNKKIKTKYGKKEISFNLSGLQADIQIINSKTAPSPKDIWIKTKKEIKEKLKKLIKKKSFPKLIVIAVPDQTRKWPIKLLEILLETLLSIGIKPKQITLIIALGLHKGLNKKEKIDLLGKGIVNKFKIINHEPCNTKKLKNLGKIKIKNITIPVEINRAACEADILIGVGLVEPHQYAGFSGGSKIISIGLGGHKTISTLHSVKLLKKPSIKFANFKNNLFYDFCEKISKKDGLDFCINTVINNQDKPIKIICGQPETVRKNLCLYYKKHLSIKIKKQFDILILGIDYPKSKNFYQASRAISYLVFKNPSPIIKKDGVVILCAPCEDKWGKGTGEKMFAKYFIDKNSNWNKACGGAQRAYVMKEVAKQCRIVVTSKNLSNVSNLIKTEPSPNKALKRALNIVDKDHRIKIGIMPDAFSCFVLGCHACPP
jgi:nickel-dependent lactate racemase